MARIMKEQDIKNAIRMSAKAPSADFTDKLMRQIEAQEALGERKSEPRLIVGACFLVAILSLFVELPDLEIMNQIIRINPIISPIVGLIILLYAAYQLQESSGETNS